MLSLDDPASPTVVHASSFTKTVCPGVRVGYLIGPTQTIDAIARRAINTYISPNMLAEVTVFQFCESGDIERSIATVRTALAERAGSLGCRSPAGDPGLRIPRTRRRLLPLGRASRGRRCGAARAGRDGPRGRGGEGHRFPARGWASQRCGWRIRRSPPDQIDEGVRRLAAAIKDVGGA